MQKASFKLHIVNNWQEETCNMDLSMVLWENYKRGFPLCCQKQIGHTHTKTATDGLETHRALCWKVLDLSHKILKSKGIQRLLLRQMLPTLPLNTTPHTWSGEVFDLNCPIYQRQWRIYACHRTSQRQVTSTHIKSRAWTPCGVTAGTLVLIRHDTGTK